MSKYFIDTEFLERKQDKSFLGIKYGETKPTIDLISIGIVSEDDRKYYAISKDFNIKEAWNRWQPRTGCGDRNNTDPKHYWLRENVLKPVFDNLTMQDRHDDKHSYFTYSNFKYLINKYGKTNKQIAHEISLFVGCYTETTKKLDDNNNWFEETNNIIADNVRFYAYYADYDWVVFCQLFGTMMQLPKGFPMFAFDIQQQIEEYKINKEQLLKEVPQINCHNSLHDAIWNKDAYNWIQKKIK